MYTDNSHLFCSFVSSEFVHFTVVKLAIACYTETFDMQWASFTRRVLCLGVHLGDLFGCHDRPLCTAGAEH